MSERICTVGDCGRRVKAHDLCQRHYERLRAHGHTDPTRRGQILAECYTEGPRDECWPWHGSITTDGYGRFGTHRAHRLLYVQMRGPIPGGLDLDHLCRNKPCVNPWHLEPVEMQENLYRGVRGFNHPELRSMCRAGLHDITDPNNWFVGTHGKYAWRTCRECKRASERRSQARYRAKRKQAKAVTASGCD